MDAVVADLVGVGGRNIMLLLLEAVDLAWPVGPVAVGGSKVSNMDVELSIGAGIALGAGAATGGGGTACAGAGAGVVGAWKNMEAADVTRLMVAPKAPSPSSSSYSSRLLAAL